MVRIFGHFKILAVTVDTIVANAVKTQLRLRLVAINTGQGAVNTNQRETIGLVKFGNVVDQPGFRGVAPDTIVANTLAVHILVAGGAIGGRFRKDQGSVAVAAIHLGMHAFQSKSYRVMVEVEGVNVYFPASCIVTCPAIHSKSISMRRLPESKNTLEKQNCYEWQSMHLNRSILYRTISTPLITSVLWHAPHSISACRPSSGNSVRL